MQTRLHFLLCSLVLICHSPIATAFSFDDLLDQGKELGQELLQEATGQSGTTLDSATIVKGLKEALEKGSNQAVSLAGRHDGYFKNPEIKIPLPDKAARYSSALRKVGLGEYVDEFDESMNRAAEKAAPIAAEYFIGALKEMSIDDAYQLLRGPDDAATEYFRDKTSDKLTTAFRPSVDASLSDVGAVKAYKTMQDKADNVGLGSHFDFNISDYVTAKALDGLFTLIAEEEKNIRENPAARTTEILQQVFE